MSGCDDLDVVAVDAERLGGDLRKDRVGALADLGARRRARGPQPSGVPRRSTTDCRCTSPEPVKPAPCMNAAKPDALLDRAPADSRARSARASRGSPTPASARSSSAGMSTGSEIVCPTASVSPGLMKLRRRNSSGERPTAAATRSMCRSSAKMLCGAPKPRNAPCGGTLVATARPCTRTFGHDVRPGGVDRAARQHDRRQRAVGAAVDR